MPSFELIAVIALVVLAFGDLTVGVVNDAVNFLNSAICSDVGIGPTQVTDVVVVFKAFVTRVGSPRAEPMPGQLTEEETRQKGWEEYGTVTGRLRRAAPFNINLAKRSIMLNGATKIAVTKLDVLFPEDANTTSFDDLSYKAKNWIKEKEEQLRMKFSWIGTGPADVDIIDREKI